MLDQTTTALTQQGATFLYPSVPDKFTVDENVLAQGYRKQLGYNRVLGIAVATILAGWLMDYVRGQL